MTQARKATTKPATMKVTKEVVIAEFTLDQAGSDEYLPSAFARISLDVAQDDFQDTPCVYRLPENDHPEARTIAVAVEVE